MTEHDKHDIDEVQVQSNSFALIFDEINDEIAKNIVQFIIENSFSNPKPDLLNILINSPGGDMYAAFAIIDVMAVSTVPIRTVGLGQIASAGLMIFMAGTKGQRILTPNTSIMSHQWSGGSTGKAGELFAMGKEFSLTSTRMINHYRKHTGLTEKKIKQFLLPPHDVFLSAEEALGLKLCDKVANLA